MGPHGKNKRGEPGRNLERSRGNLPERSGRTNANSSCAISLGFGGFYRSLWRGGKRRADR